jgi:hypothetical protein
MRSRLSISTLTAYDAASTPMTAAGPVIATRIPANDGPAIVVAERASPYRVFALPSWSGGAISTVSPCSAGVKNASPVPRNDTSTKNTHSGGRPANGASGNRCAGTSSTASSACAQQRSTSALSITLRRPNRSAIAPATAISSTIGTTLENMTKPSAVVP